MLPHRAVHGGDEGNLDVQNVTSCSHDRSSLRRPQRNGVRSMRSCYTRIALTQKLRRIIDGGVGYGLALEGISAAEVARSAEPGR